MNTKTLKQMKEILKEGICFSHRHKVLDSHLTQNRHNIAFVNNIKYLLVIFDKRITLRLHTEMIEAKALRTFISLSHIQR